ncbi:hypothetical protein [Candidatus Poriferisocius sp.]|uniref:hypothetical protein n=1 Tax=Candidatus Poriferisocius sp. TaxID=3101276 RepID=UPI003B01F015
MRNKWVTGICPRNFHWIMRDRFAICERPGGRGESHRRVRRTEEINWIRQQGFTRVVSLIPSTHNLHNYSEQNIAWNHWPIADNEDYRARLGPLFVELRSLLAAGEKLLVHRRALGDVVCGFTAGYLLWSGMVASEPQVVVVVEKLTGRPLGSVGRGIVSIALTLPKPGEQVSETGEPDTDEGLNPPALAPESVAETGEPDEDEGRGGDG